MLWVEAHVLVKPATPRFHGKVERSHRIDAEEFYRLLDGITIDDAELFSDKLREREDYYHFERPHAPPFLIAPSRKTSKCVGKVVTKFYV